MPLGNCQQAKLNPGWLQPGAVRSSAVMHIKMLTRLADCAPPLSPQTAARLLSPPCRPVCIAAGAGDDQHIFDLNVRLQYSNDVRVLLAALEVTRQPQCMRADRYFGLQMTGVLRLAMSIWPVLAVPQQCNIMSGAGTLSCHCWQALDTAVAVDVPAEALLQRQSLMDNVLALLRPASLDSPLPAAALRLLHTLVSRLRAAVITAHDPGLQLLAVAQPGEGGLRCFREHDCSSLPGRCLQIHLLPAATHNSGCWLRASCRMCKFKPDMGKSCSLKHEVRPVECPVRDGGKKLPGAEEG